MKVLSFLSNCAFLSLASGNEAWVYNQKQGTLETAALSSSRQIRCVGISLQ